MSFIRKSILVSGGQTVGVALGVLVGILYSRVLGPDGIGQYRLFCTTAVIAMTIAALGIGNANIYFLNNRKVSITAITTNTVKLSIVMGLLLATVMAATFMMLPGYFGHISIPVTIIFAMGIGMMLGTALLHQILTAQMAARRMVSADLIRAVVVLVGGGLLAAFGWLSPETGLMIMALACFSHFTLVLIYLRRHIVLSLSFDWGLFGRMLSYGIKLASANILFLLSLEMSVMLLRYLKPDQFYHIGLYSRAVTVSGLIVIIPRMFGSLLFSKWSGVTGEVRTRQAEMVLRSSMAYAVPATAAVMLLGKYVILILYGAEFVPAAGALRILAPATVFMTIFGTCSSLLAGDGRAAITAYILAGTVIIILVVTYLLVPAMGIRGAAVGALCGNGFMALASFAACRKLYRLNLLRCLLVRKSDLTYIRQALKPRNR